MAYSSYDVARQILQLREYNAVPVSSCVELPKDVLSALLWLTAEWRNVWEMEHLIAMGADPHEKNDGFTVLEVFIQGHDGSWLGKERVKEVEDGVKMLTRFRVTHEDLKNDWILDNCKDIINNSEYLMNFFKVEKKLAVNFYYHAPRAEVFSNSQKSIPFPSIDEAVRAFPTLTALDQYVAVLECQGEVTRYLVTKKAGPLEIIPMELKPGWNKNQEKVSNIVNFVMARDDYPTLPCEEDDDC